MIFGTQSNQESNQCKNWNSFSDPDPTSVFLISILRLFCFLLPSIHLKDDYCPSKCPVNVIYNTVHTRKNPHIATSHFWNMGDYVLLSQSMDQKSWFMGILKVEAAEIFDEEEES